MNQTKFIEELSLVSNSYSWTHHGTSLLGVAKNVHDRGAIFNPVTALARSKRLGSFQNTSQGTKNAAEALGLSSITFASVLSSENRGNAKVVRGRMLNKLGVS